MAKKIVVVGGVAGGASVAARCRRLDEDAEILVLERGEHPSYSNCSLPNFLSREVPTSDMLLMMTPEKFKKQYNIEVRVLNEVTKIDPEKKCIEVKDLEKDKTYEEDYDELVLATGADAVMPRSIKGIDLPQVFSLKDVADVRGIDAYIKNHDAKKMVVVGGGFIGLEVVEHLKYAGYDVTLVEGQDQVMPPIDNDMAQILHKVLYDAGVKLYLSETVEEITEKEVILSSKKSIPADLVIMSIGVRPNTELAKDAGIEIGTTGGIKVDHNYQTSAEHVYAVGDVIETHNFQTGEPTRLALAGPAQRQARACANAIYGLPNHNKGVVGASVLRLFDFNCASVGLSERELKKREIPYEVAFVMPFDKVSLMPDANPMFFKLIFHAQSGKILGAQAIGQGAVDKRIDVISTLIQMDGTLYDLQELELCYAPAFGTAKDVVNMAGFVGMNLLNGVYEQVRMTEVPKLVEEGATFIDVRQPAAYEKAHIRGAINIPLTELRDRLDEVPKDRTVYVYCRTSLTSYLALRVLQNNGFTNVKNTQGSMLGLSHYVYFKDKTTDRESILTGYVLH